MSKEDIFALPIDQYSRQKWAQKIIDLLRVEKETKFKILDLGGHKGKTSEFQKNDEVIIADLFKVDYKNYVQVDGTGILPFNSNSFDIAVSFDTYEHVPRNIRKKFISEVLRVSSKGFILAAPFDDGSNIVVDAEMNMNEYYKSFYGKDHPWLKEHIEYKIPHSSEINELLEKLNLNYTSIKSNDINLWILMQSLYFSIEADEDFRGRVDTVNRKYNNNLEHLDLCDENTVSYRRIYFISKDIKLVKLVSAYFENISSDNHIISEFNSFALKTFGEKYRDLVFQNKYLNEEIIKLKSHNNKLEERNKILEETERHLRIHPVTSKMIQIQKKIKSKS